MTCRVILGSSSTNYIPSPNPWVFVRVGGRFPELDTTLEIGVGGGNWGSGVIDPATDPKANTVAFPGSGALKPESNPLTNFEPDAVVVSGGGVSNNQGLFIRAAVTFGIAILLSLRRTPIA
jgi:hypothetical protein